MDEKQKLFGLMTIVEQQQKMLDATLAKLDAEREALAKERGALQQTVHQSVNKSLSGVADTVSQALQAAIKPSADTLTDSVRSAYEASVHLSESMRRVQSAWTWRILGLAVGLMLIVGLSAWGLVRWERSQIEDLKVTRQTLQADINRMQLVVKDLEKRGGRLEWSTCGDRVCIEASRNQGAGAELWNGAWWRNNQTGRLFVIPKGW